MNGKTMSVIAGLCSIAVSGCTSLQSVSLNGKSNGNAPSGLTYRLPAKQFSVKATYEITKCTPTGNGMANLNAKVSASFTESLIGAEAYTIDYQQLNAWTKVANTEFQLSETGLLTGVNASIADQTGAVIRNAVTAAASIARAVAFPHVSVMMPESSRFTDACDQVNTTLEKIRTTKKELDAEKTKDDKRAMNELRIRGMVDRIKAFKDLAEIYEKLGDKKDRDDLLALVKYEQKKVGEAEKELKELSESKTETIAKQLDEAKGKLVIVASKDFVPSISRTSDNKIIRDGWSVDVTVTSGDLSKVVGEKIDPSKIKLPVVTMTIEIAKGLSIDENQAAIGPDPNKIGIAYRTPVAAVAKVFCKGEDACNPQVSLLEKSTQIPQLGPIGSINLDNAIFDENLIELAFNGATGTPSKLTFRAKSKAEAASATIKDAAGTYLQLQKEKRDDRIAANKALLDQATAQVTLDKAKSDLALSKVQANASAATTEAELQQALVTAQLQLLRDQYRLDAVRTGTATSAEMELEGLSTQEKLLKQRLSILKLEQGISEQKARNLSATVP